MLAALPIAHQPCGANGAQLSPPRLGSATPTAVAITTTRAAESTSWNPDETRSPHALAPSTTPHIARPTPTATVVPDPVRSAT